MNKKLVVAIIVLAVVIIGLVLYLRAYPVESTLQNPTESTPSEIQQIDIVATGFVPKTVTIKQGQTVRWTNHNVEEAWPEAVNVFDAGSGLKQNESYQFTFNELGSWNYRDHLNPSRSGRIIVAP